MKHINKLLLVIVLISLAVLALPGSVLADSPARSQDDKVVLGGTYTLSSGNTLDGNLAVIGGTATIEKSAVVTGDAVLTGGTLDISGEIKGNISAFGGTVFLNNGAVVDGNISLFGATIHKAPDAKVVGNTVNGSQGPFNFNLPNRVFIPRPFIDFQPLANFYGWLGQTLAIAFLALLVGLVAPNATGRAAQVAVSQSVIAGGYGLLTIIVAPIVLLLMALTILLIPVSLIGFFVLALALLYAWIVVALEAGRRINRISKVEWSPAVQAGLGSIVLSIIVGILNFVCIGWLVWFVILIVGLGAVVLTRFGTRPYPPFGFSGPAAAASGMTPYGPVPPAPIAPAGPTAAPAAYSPSSVVDVYPSPEPDQPPAGPENI